MKRNIKLDRHVGTLQLLNFSEDMTLEQKCIIFMKIREINIAPYGSYEEAIRSLQQESIYIYKGNLYMLNYNLYIQHVGPNDKVESLYHANRIIGKVHFNILCNPGKLSKENVLNEAIELLNSSDSNCSQTKLYVNMEEM